MIVKTVNSDIFLPYVGTVGKALIKDVLTEIPDKVYYEKSFSDLVESGDIIILSFGRNKTSYVVQGEMQAFTDGLFEAKEILSGTADSGNGEGVISLSTDVSDSFVFASSMILNLLVDGLYTEVINVPKGTYTFAELVVEINPQAVHFDFKSDGTPNFWAETKSKGASSSIVIQAVDNNANDILLLPVSAANTSTLVAKGISFTVKGPTGKAVSNAKLVMGIWDAASAGSLVADARFQVVTKGSFNTLYANVVEMISDENGEIVFEIVKDVTGTVYVNVAPDIDYFMAVTPAARLVVAVA